MGNPYDEIKRMSGLWTHGNPLNAPDGGMLVADNAEINREDMVTRRRGYRTMSANLPAFRPDQLISIGGVLYLNLDTGLWYWNGTQWLLKTGTTGFLLVNARGAAVYNGELFFVDQLRHVVMGMSLATGAVRILVGRWSKSGTANGVGDAARFNSLRDICSDNTGNLYVCDGANNKIRKIVISTATVSDFAGSGAPGTANGTGIAATFTSPSGICYDGTGALYVTETTDVRKITIPGAVVTTPYAGAGLIQPSGLCFNNGFVWVTSFGNATLHKINVTSGVDVTVSITGTLPRGATTDGTLIYVTEGAVVDIYNATTNALVSSYSITSGGWPALVGTKLIYTTASSNIRVLYMPSGYNPVIAQSVGGGASSWGQSYAGTFMVGPT